MADAILRRAKYPDERLVIAWDFIDDLDADDSLKAVGATDSRVKATNQAGTDVSTTVLEGAVVFETQLRVILKAGAAGDDLLIRFIGETTLGSQFERVVSVRVRA